MEINIDSTVYEEIDKKKLKKMCKESFNDIPIIKTPVRIKKYKRSKKGRKT